MKAEYFWKTMKKIEACWVANLKSLTELRYVVLSECPTSFDAYIYNPRYGLKNKGVPLGHSVVLLPALMTLRF